MIHCNDCRYWQQTESRGVVGICLVATDGAKEDHMVVMSGDDTAYLATFANHGCTAGEAKGEIQAEECLVDLYPADSEAAD
jgi:hypothetical protein